MKNQHLKIKAWDVKNKEYINGGEFQTDGDGDWTYYVSGHCMCGWGCNDEWLSVPNQIEMHFEFEN